MKRQIGVLLFLCCWTFPLLSQSMQANKTTKVEWLIYLQQHFSSKRKLEDEIKGNSQVTILPSRGFTVGWGARWMLDKQQFLETTLSYQKLQLCYQVAFNAVNIWKRNHIGTIGRESVGFNCSWGRYQTLSHRWRFYCKTGFRFQYFIRPVTYLKLQNYYSNPSMNTTSSEMISIWPNLRGGYSRVSYLGKILPLFALDVGTTFLIAPKQKKYLDLSLNFSGALGNQNIGNLLFFYFNPQTGQLTGRAVFSPQLATFSLQLGLNF